MIEIKAPEDISEVLQDPKKIKIFLAGSIEMGSAEPWQEAIVEALEGVDNLVILNPRREDWDSSWEQDISNPQFKEQVSWELRAMEQADLILMYFDPKTKSPITLLELGLYARGGKLCVCCPKGYWRKGNVDVVCQTYGVKQVNTLDDLIERAKETVAPQQPPEDNPMEKLRDMAGLLSKEVLKRTYMRFKLGDRVRYFNPNQAMWDVGEVTSIRNLSTYIVRNPDHESAIVEWYNLRPI